MSELILSLEQRIIAASFNYYEGVELLMSDAQFDTLVDSLRKLDPTNWILSTPGWGYNSDKSKVRHIGKNPVGSLDKQKYPNLPDTWKKTCLVMGKLDGMTVVVYVEDGKITAATRNEGTIGKDCSNKVIHILKTKFPVAYAYLTSTKGFLAIRGEILIDPAVQSAVTDSGTITLRNYANGIMNRLEVTKELDNLTFIPYFVRVSTKIKFKNHLGMLEWMLSIGLTPASVRSVSALTSDELLNIYSIWKKNHLLDGLVLSSNENFEDTVDYSYYESTQLAYKFDGDTAEAVVGKVIWTTGSAGRLAPVAVLTEPVELSQAMIQNISCHHAQYIVDQGIGPGSLVLVTRANEIIPQIVNVITKVEAKLPTECPACSSPVKMDGCYLMCTKFDCIAIARTSIYRFLELSGDIDGLGDTVKAKWLDTFPVNQATVSLESIFDFICQFKAACPVDTRTRLDLLVTQFGSHYGTLLWKFEKLVDTKICKGLSYSDFWYVLNLPTLGESNSKKLSTLNPNDPKDIDKCTTVPYTVRETITENLPYISRLANQVITYPETTVAKPRLFGYAVTGPLEYGTRSKFAAKMIEYDIVEVSVGKACTFLITNRDSNTSKAKAAAAQGTKVVTEVQFLEILKKEYNIDL